MNKPDIVLCRILPPARRVTDLRFVANHHRSREAVELGGKDALSGTVHADHIFYLPTERADVYTGGPQETILQPHQPRVMPALELDLNNSTGGAAPHVKTIVPIVDDNQISVGISLGHERLDRAPGQDDATDDLARDHGRIDGFSRLRKMDRFDKTMPAWVDPDRIEHGHHDFSGFVETGKTIGRPAVSASQ